MTSQAWSDFSTADGIESLIPFPLVLPMGWKNSQQIFSTATETIANLGNHHIARNIYPLSHDLDELGEQIISPSPLSSSLLHSMWLLHILVPRHHLSTGCGSWPTPPLSISASTLCVNVFVDNLLGLSSFILMLIESAISCSLPLMM